MLNLAGNMSGYLSIRNAMAYLPNSLGILLHRFGTSNVTISIYIYIYIYIIIIILSCHQHVYPCPFLATSPYCSSLLVAPLGYIPYPHRAAVCRFEPVSLPLLGHVRGSIGELHLCFSSSVLHVWFV